MSAAGIADFLLAKAKTGRQRYNLGSAISFLLVINLGGIAGMLVAGRLANRFGARPVAIIWFALTACGSACWRCTCRTR